MATNIIETPERSGTGRESGKTPQQEEIPATTGFVFTDEQRKILAQTYRMILSWAKADLQAGTPVTAADTEA